MHLGKRVGCDLRTQNLQNFTKKFVQNLKLPRLTKNKNGKICTVITLDQYRTHVCGLKSALELEKRRKFLQFFYFCPKKYFFHFTLRGLWRKTEETRRRLLLLLWRHIVLQLNLIPILLLLGGLKGFKASSASHYFLSTWIQDPNPVVGRPIDPLPDFALRLKVMFLSYLE